jgi:phosphatidylserine synthase
MAMTEPTNSPEPGTGRGESDDGNCPGISIAGLAVVLVGAVFLARNFGMNLPLPDRWWAIFILLPAAASLVQAARFYRFDERFSSRVAGSATAGVLMLAVALILFLNLKWAVFWPVMVIIVGLGIIARGTARRRR